MSTETLMTDGATATDTAASQTAGDATQVADAADQQQASTADAKADTTAQAKADDAPKVPDSYEFKVPEGRNLTPELKAEFEETAKANGWTQEQAQAHVDAHVKWAEKFEATQKEAIANARSEWEAAAKADKEFGGEKFDENISVAKEALKQFGTPELGKLLDESGLGSHPEVIRFFVKAGKAISEDGVVTGGAGKAEPKSLAQQMYPSMNP